MGVGLCPCNLVTSEIGVKSAVFHRINTRAGKICLVSRDKIFVTSLHSLHSAESAELVLIGISHKSALGRNKHYEL